ncbi:MAG: FAD-binding oxidoreductase [Chloroflexi bacterium]|nr:FAD-binding oxidoreductase [Chloroflexota bacterium]
MTAKIADVVVLGGGVVGCATAYYLGKEGKQVIIIERESVGSHSSGFAYGALSPLGGDGIPGPLLPLTIAAMKLHLGLSLSLPQETGIDIQFRLKPTLSLAFAEEEAERLKANFLWQQKQHGYQVEWLEAKELNDLDPRISSKALGGVYTEGTAEVDSYRFILALAQAAEKYGTVIRHGEIRGLEKDGGGIKVILASGEIVCQEAVLAMGPWTGSASRWLGQPVPIEPLKGEILRLQAPGPPLQSVIGWAGNYASTKPDALIWAGTTEEKVGFDEIPTHAARDKIMRALLNMLPALGEAQLIRQTACLRPYCVDGLPIIGQAYGWESVYLATGAGRKGILLGPLMGRIVADMILKRDIDMPVQPFSPTRFARTKETD